MFEETKILPFFPTAIWTHVLGPEVYEPLNERLKKNIYELMASMPETARQSRNDLHKLKEFEELVPYIKQATSGALDFLHLDYNSFRITGCWANIMTKGDPEHKAHTHPNNYLSGVYYVQVQEGADVINFHDPRFQVNIISPKRKQLNEYNTRDVHLTVRNGSLVLFPSWLSHSVAPSQSETDRLSISVNIMFDSFAEEMSPPKWRAR